MWSEFKGSAGGGRLGSSCTTYRHHLPREREKPRADRWPGTGHRTCSMSSRFQLGHHPCHHFHIKHMSMLKQQRDVESRIRDMLELLPLAALSLILNHVAQRRYNTILSDCCSCTRTSLTLSGWFLSTHGQARTRTRTRFLSCPMTLSASHSGAGEMTRLVQLDPRPRRSVMSRRPLDPARRCRG